MPNAGDGHDPGRRFTPIGRVGAILVVPLALLLAATFPTSSIGRRVRLPHTSQVRLSLYAADAGIRTEQQLLANLAQSKLDSCVANWNARGGHGLVIANPGALFPNGITHVSSSDPAFGASGSIAWSDSEIRPESQSYDYQFTILSSGTVGNSDPRRVQSLGTLRLRASQETFADYLCFFNQAAAAGGGTSGLATLATPDGRVHPGEAALPTNAWRQQEAALGLPETSAAPTNFAIRLALHGGAGRSVPPDGIYVVNDGVPANGTSGAMTGGIYVQGGLSRACVWADTLHHRQWYLLEQGSTARTLKVDPAAGTTSVWDGTITSCRPNRVYSGAPHGVLFVTGTIRDLRGPDRVRGQVPPAIAEHTRLLIAATGDIVIQRDLSLEGYEHGNNVLGILSSGGAVRIGDEAPNDMSLDAFVMAADATHGEFAVDHHDSGPPRGTLHLRGGIVEQYCGAFLTLDAAGRPRSGYMRGYHHDGRGLVPPGYPSLTRFKANPPSARTLAWKEL